MGLEPVTEMTEDHEQPLEQPTIPDDLSLEDFLKDLAEENLMLLQHTMATCLIFHILKTEQQSMG